MGIGIHSVEHGLAVALHDISTGAKAVEAVLIKASAVTTADAPTIEAITGLIDPRAEVVERVSFALLGIVLPQVTKVAATTAAETSAPTVVLTAEMVQEILALAATLGPEIAAAKAAVAQETNGPGK